MALTFNDVPADQVPPGIETVPALCPYEISASGAITRRAAGSTRPAPVPCPVVTQRAGETSAYTRADPRQVATKGQIDLKKVADHRVRVLEPICRSAQVPAPYLEACKQYLQTRGGTIEQFMQLLQQDPAALQALQAEAMAFLAAAQASQRKGSAWPWLLGGLVLAGGVTAAVLVVRKRRQRSGGARAGGGLRGGELGKSTDLVRAYNDMIAHPSRYTRREIQQLATRLDYVSAAPGRGSLARRADTLRALLDDHREAA